MRGVTRHRTFSHAAVRVVAKVVVLAAIVGAMAAAIIPAEPLRLNVRWAPGVSDEQRTELERQFTLSGGELLDGTTRRYLLIDTSRTSIERIVRHPGVEDTSNVDRSTFRRLTTSDRTKRIWGWMVVLALAGTTLWELVPIVFRALARPVTLQSGFVFALIGGAPALLLAVLGAVVVAAVFGIHPLWPDEAPNLAHAAYEEDLALLERTVGAGGDPNARHTVFIDGRTVSVTPLEAAVAAGSLRTVQWLITNGASTDPNGLKRVQCLAARIDAADIVTYLKTIQDSGSCDGVELPINY
jgi:hypothetical protein